MLCACVNANRLPAPLTVDLGALGPCETILKRVPLPDVKATDDARRAFVQDEAALMAANDRIDAGGACVADVRKQYEGQK